MATEHQGKLEAAQRIGSAIRDGLRPQGQPPVSQSVNASAQGIAVSGSGNFIHVHPPTASSTRVWLSVAVGFLGTAALVGGIILAGLALRLIG